jgi:hypothetical protein
MSGREWNYGKRKGIPGVRTTKNYVVGYHGLEKALFFVGQDKVFALLALRTALYTSMHVCTF